MGLLDARGKAAAKGPLVLYHLANGLMLYSEEVREDGDSFYFDGEKTVLARIEAHGDKADVKAQKLSESSFNPMGLRLLKSSVQMVTDLNDDKIKELVMQAMTGLILPTAN